MVPFWRKMGSGSAEGEKIINHEGHEGHDGIDVVRFSFV
jgi:hypothetical protein